MTQRRWASSMRSLAGGPFRTWPREVFAWAGYNFVVYAVVSFVFFRRRYAAEALNLRSSDRRNDVLVIVVVLLLESLVELLGLSSAVFQLDPRQLLLGAPLTFATGAASEWRAARRGYLSWVRA